MVKTLKLRQTGGSVSATLPKEMAERLNLSPGDQLYAVDTDDGILLTPFDPDFEKVMETYRRGARKYRQALHRLAQ